MKRSREGTGKWTAQEAMEDWRVPTPTIAEAVFARSLSALKDEQARAAKLLNGPKKEFDGDHDQLLEDIRQALYLSKICSYAQGFALLREVSSHYEWNLDLGQVALIWQRRLVLSGPGSWMRLLGPLPGNRICLICSWILTSSKPSMKDSRLSGGLSRQGRPLEFHFLGLVLPCFTMTLTEESVCRPS